MANFQIIVAVDKRFGIGKAGGLPWHLPPDLKHFRQITSSPPEAKHKNVVIMGRKTWDSVPPAYRPLPDRSNWVITANDRLCFPPGVRRFRSASAALGAVTDFLAEPGQRFFIIGGARVFRSAVEHPGCQKIFMTHILHDFECDTFFPDIPSRFRPIMKTDVFQCHGLSFYFAEYRFSS